MVLTPLMVAPKCFCLSDAKVATIYSLMLVILLVVPSVPLLVYVISINVSGVIEQQIIIYQMSQSAHPEDIKLG